MVLLGTTSQSKLTPPRRNALRRPNKEGNQPKAKKNPKHTHRVHGCHTHVANYTAVFSCGLCVRAVAPFAAEPSKLI